jgi:pimeloyl-CoA synthetase
MHEFEISKKRKLVPTEEIESIIKEYLKAGALHSNSIINLPSEKYEELNKFENSILSIAVGDIPVSKF